jgi:hypothetical protein
MNPDLPKSLPARLRLVARDPRVTRRTSGPRQTGLITASAIWAQAIASRYCRRGALGGWLEKVLRRTGPASGSSAAAPSRTAVVQFAPRMTFNLIRPTLPVLNTTRWELRATIGTERERTFLAAPERRPLAMMIERIFSHSVRRERDVSADRPAARAETVSEPGAQPAKGPTKKTFPPADSTPVYRRTKPAPSAATVSAGARAPAVTEAQPPLGERLAARGASRLPALVTPDTLPPVLMGRITDQVIDAIERRFNAQRERRGTSRRAG